MMNKDQQKTVNEMIKAMELDTYGEKGLKEIIRQAVVEIVNRSAPPKREPLSDEEITTNTPKLIPIGERLAFHAGIRWAEHKHGIGGGE